MSKYFYVFVCLFLVIIVTSSDKAQSQIANISAQVLLKGVIKDTTTGKPYGVNIEFRNKSGKKIKTISNSINGSYEQLLPAGEEYEVLFTAWDLIRQSETISTVNADGFKEQIKNFTVKRMIPEHSIYKLLAFNSGSEIPTEEIKNAINEISTLMRFNRSVELEIIIDASDVIQPTGKKAKTIDTKPLVDNRVQIIDKLADVLGVNKKRISIKADYSPKETDKNKNITVVVTKIEDLFNK